MSKTDQKALPTKAEILSLAFREAFRCHPAGVAVLTADPGDRPVALTVSSLISVSASPPIVAFSLSSRSSSAAALLSSGSIVIHLLRYPHLDIAQLAAAAGAERFGPGIEWERLPTGEPRYSRVGTWFLAAIRKTLSVGEATIVAAELLEGQVEPRSEAPETESLIYLDQRWHRLREVGEASI